MESSLLVEGEKLESTSPRILSRQAVRTAGQFFYRFDFTQPPTAFSLDGTNVNTNSEASADRKVRRAASINLAEIIGSSWLDWL
jgi:hypothetical protein